MKDKPHGFLDSWLINKKDFNNFSSLKDQIKFTLNYAILAPSTHNSQPWLFRIKDNSCEIYLDEAKRLPQADQSGRDMYISLGCATENLVTAAKYFNIFDKIEYDNGRLNLVAVVYFKDNSKQQKNLEWGSLLDAIPQRVNARGVFEDKPVPREVINRISQLTPPEEIEIRFISDKNLIHQLAGLTAQGIKVAYDNKKFRQEAGTWINPSSSKKSEGIPGYALKAPFLLSYLLPSIIKNFNIGKKLSALNYQSVDSAPLICVISSEEETSQSWLKIGRLAERLMLEFNAAGLNTSVFVAAIEMGSLQNEVQKIINTKTQPQFIFCAGYLSGKYKHTPRHGVNSKTITAKIKTDQPENNTVLKSSPTKIYTQQPNNLTKQYDHQEIRTIHDSESGIKGVIAIHRSINGKPSFGATRYWAYKHESDALADALRLSKLMSYKSAMAGFPYGGAKGVLIKNPTNNKQKILRSYSQEVNKLKGKFITGADVGINHEEVSYMKKHCKYIVGTHVDPAGYTALGLLYATKESLEEYFGSESIDGRSFAIQGLGKVGQKLVSYLALRGAKIFVTDINKDKVRSIIRKFPKVKYKNPEDLVSLDVDVFSPCALGGAVNPNNIHKLRCKIIVGGANNQLWNSELSDTLHKKNILYAPDYIVNAGGLMSVIDEYEHGHADPLRITQHIVNIRQTLKKVYQISRANNEGTQPVANKIAKLIIQNGKTVTRA